MKRTRMKQGKGRRRAAEHDAYTDARDELRMAHPECQLGAAIATVDPGHRCRRVYEGPHHLRKTGQGGAATLLANMLSACNPCNDWVEDHPTLATSLGLVVTEGDPRWEQLGRRAERLA